MVPSILFSFCWRKIASVVEKVTYRDGLLCKDFVVILVVIKWGCGGGAFFRHSFRISSKCRTFKQILVKISPKNSYLSTTFLTLSQRWKKHPWFLCFFLIFKPEIHMTAEVKSAERSQELTTEDLLSAITTLSRQKNSGEWELVGIDQQLDRVRWWSSMGPSI